MTNVLSERLAADSPRSRGLDLLRGILVLGMIVVHVTIHLSSMEIPESWYLWIPTGFVAAAGLLGSLLSQRKSHRALFWRGVRLLLLVLVFNLPLRMNIAAQLIEPTVLRFEILVPIAITIMSIPLMLRVPWPRVWLMLIIAGIAYLDWFQWFPFLLKFLSIGIASLFIGRLNIGRALMNDQRSTPRFTVPLLLVAVVASVMLRPSLLVSLLLVLALLSLLPRIVVPNTLMTNTIARLGSHSLLLYIFHVVVIVILGKFHVFQASSMGLSISIIVALTLLCVFFVQCVEWLIAHNQTCRWLYRMVLR